MKRYFIRVLTSIDQLVNTLIGGWPDETISSRCGRRAASHWWWRWLAAVLNVFDHNHAYESMLRERAGTHLPPELR